MTKTRLRWIRTAQVAALCIVAGVPAAARAYYPSGWSYVCSWKMSNTGATGTSAVTLFTSGTSVFKRGSITTVYPDGGSRTGTVALADPVALTDGTRPSLS